MATNIESRRNMVSGIYLGIFLLPHQEMKQNDVGSTPPNLVLPIIDD